MLVPGIIGVGIIGVRSIYARTAIRVQKTSRLLVEVSDTTLSKDRGEKLVNYARSDIPVYWIVNLVDRQVEVDSGPRPTVMRRQTFTARVSACPSFWTA